MKLTNNDIGKWFIFDNGIIFKLNDITMFDGIDQVILHIPAWEQSERKGWAGYQKDYIEHHISARVSIKP